MIDIISNPDKETWREFVNNHPRGNIFQAPEIAEVYHHTRNYLPLTLAAVDSHSDEITALVSAAIIHEFGEPLKNFTSRSIILGGPLYEDSPRGYESVKILIEQYDAIAGRQAVYTEIRNFWNTDNLPVPVHYAYEEHLNYLVDVSAGKEKLWKNLSRSRKTGITKSRKMGVEIHEISSKKELDTVYSLLKETYARARHPLSDKSLFESAYARLVQKNLGKVFFACHKDIPVAVNLILTYKDHIYAWYGGSIHDNSTLFPMDHLVWHVLEWGSLNHYSIYDFMGAGKPNEEYGVREFKRQFGGELVNYGRYKKVHSPVKNLIAQSGLAVYKQAGNYFKHGRIHP
jgi:serine/alanine adding enzyme